MFDYQEVNHAHISWGVEELQVALRSMRIHIRVLHPNPVQQYRSGLICIESPVANKTSIQTISTTIKLVNVKTIKQY